MVHDERVVGPRDDESLAQARSMAHGEQLARIARKFPDRTAFICRDSVRTFAEVDGRVDRLAASLRRLGVGAGDRLALLMGNSIELVEAMFAGWRLGAIVVPINFRLTSPEVQFILGDCSASVLVVDAALAPLVEPVRDSLGALRHVVVFGGVEPGEAEPGPAATAEALDLSDLVQAPCEDPVRVHVDEQDPALIMYTSGTTGRPKGAVLSHFNLFMSTLNSMIELGIRGEDVWYGNLPLFHIGGLSGILPYIITGGRSVIVPSTGFDPAAAVKDLIDHRVTACVFVGMQWDEICNAMEGVTDQLVLRRAAWGAAGTPVEVLAKIARTLPGIPLFSSFGQTEMSPVTCVLHAEDAERKQGSVGRPIVNLEARLVDDDGHDVAVGEVGEIVYRAPTVMQGYWQMPEATAASFRDGWFHSGDLCRMDADGYIYVVDRKVDMIISGGENIYCPEVEAAVLSHPSVLEVAVVGAPHDKWGETPVAVVVPADPAHPPSEEEIIAWCRDHLASYKKPSAVEFLDALPKNAAGKVLKPVLRQRYGTARPNS